MKARPRAKLWPRGNCPALHMPSLHLCRRTGQKCQNWYDSAAYTSETIGGDHVRRFVCG